MRALRGAYTCPQGACVYTVDILPTVIKYTGWEGILETVSEIGAGSPENCCSASIEL